MNLAIPIARLPRGTVLTDELFIQLRWTSLMLRRCLTVKESRQVMKQLDWKKRFK